VTDRRLSFDGAAAEYEIGRPGYPPALFEMLAERCSLSPGAHVLEIGSGPGQATEGLIEAGAIVTAVEPGERFARRLAERFELAVLNAFFEDVELEPESFDLAMSATAFHWVDHEIGLPKILDALRPGGWLALTWARFYDPEHPVAFTAASQPIMHRHVPEYRGALTPVEDESPWTERLGGAGFTEVESHRHPWTRTETTEQVIARFLTHSGPLSLDETGKQALVADLRQLCDDRFDGTVPQAYVTVTHLGRKPVSSAR